MPAAKVVAAEISMRVLLKCSDMGGAASGTVPKAAIGRRLVAQLLSGINEVRIPEVVKLSDTLPAGHVKDAAQRLITLDDMDPRARAGARGRHRPNRCTAGPSRRAAAACSKRVPSAA